jgi:hypothetical protein
MFVTVQNITKTISLAIGPVILLFFAELIPFAVTMEQNIVSENIFWGEILLCLPKIVVMLLSAEANGNVIKNIHL